MSAVRGHAALEEGIRLFEERRWFEAHEVLESLWRPLPKGADRHFVQGLIQLAVALEHWRRGNPRGAAGQWTKAQGHFAGLSDDYAGIALRKLLADAGDYWAAVGLEGSPDGRAAHPPVPMRRG
jgi:predicted metal-dependent hydrolase